MQTRNFWTDDFPRPVDLPVSDLPERVDVAVVGAGYTGLAAARRLAHGGVRVAVLETGEVGGGASSVNGGMSIIGLKPSLRLVVRRYGEQLARELWQASVRAVDLVEELVEEEGIDCAFRRSGAGALGFTDRDHRRFEESVAWLRDWSGLVQEVIPPDRIGEVVGSHRFRVAKVERSSGGLHPARYVYGLARAAAHAGALLVEAARVRGIEELAGRFVLHTAAGRVSAEEVLVATNGYTDDLVPGLQRRVFPAGSYIVVTEPLPAGLGEELVPGGRMLWTARNFLNYFRLTPDGRLLMGGRNDLSTSLDLEESARRLRSTIVSFFPQLEGVSISHSWTGRLGITFDLLPHIGHIGGVHYALGYSGHGVPLGTYLGDEAARLIMGQLERSPFSDIGHPTRWFHRGRPWFLPLAAGWFRLRDRLGV